MRQKTVCSEGDPCCEDSQHRSEERGHIQQLADNAASRKQGNHHIL